MANINAEALIQVWLKRPDLQRIYNADGSKKNPSDGNPPNLMTWAQNFGVREEPTLTDPNYGRSTPAAPAQPAYTPPPAAAPAPQPAYNSPQPAYNQPQTQPNQSPTAPGGAAPSFAEAVNQVWLKRSDLQAVYNADGSPKNPNDPRIAGIPTLMDWVNKFGVNEEPTIAAARAASPAGGAPASSTGNPQLDELLGGLSQYLDSMVASGQTINPAIEIDPSKIAEFLSQAETEVAPYFREKITAIKTDLTKNLEYMQQQYDLAKKEREANFVENVGKTRENAAGAGLAFSGVRGRQEADLKAGEERSLDALNLNAKNSISSQLRNVESLIGSTDAGSLGIPALEAPTVSLDGRGGYAPGRTLDLGFTPGGVSGSIPNDKTYAVRSRANELEQAERARRGLNLYPV